MKKKNAKAIEPLATPYTINNHMIHLRFSLCNFSAVLQKLLRVHFLQRRTQQSPNRREYSFCANYNKISTEWNIAKSLRQTKRVV